MLPDTVFSSVTDRPRHGTQQAEDGLTTAQATARRDARSKFVKLLRSENVRLVHRCNYRGTYQPYPGSNAQFYRWKFF
jgi:hypothetical protein